MDMTQEQIAKECARQCHLCKGIGEDAMIDALFKELTIPLEESKIFLRGVQSLLRIRCVKHYTVPQYNTPLLAERDRAREVVRELYLNMTLIRNETGEAFDVMSGGVYDAARAALIEWEMVEP